MKAHLIALLLILALVSTCLLSVNHRAVAECLGGFVDSAIDHVMFDNDKQLTQYKEKYNGSN